MKAQSVQQMSFEDLGKNSTRVSTDCPFHIECNATTLKARPNYICRWRLDVAFTQCGGYKERSQAMECDEETIFEFLDALRESGVTNMFGATPYIVEAFNIGERAAMAYLTEWMLTFSERHLEGEDRD